MRALISFLLSAVLSVSSQVDGRPQNTFELSCTAVRADTSRAHLVARFGAANVVDGEVYIGEGFYETATVLFGDNPERRAELFWQKIAAKQAPRWLRVAGKKSQWRTPQGLTVGLDLAGVERLNRRPFRLSGFGWDYGGTTISWSGGVLNLADEPPCTVWARFGSGDSLTGKEQRLVGQVQRDQSFSSGHPGMQAAHARVNEIGLAWRQVTPANIALEPTARGHLANDLGNDPAAAQPGR
jgi:hypothetical protein